MIVYNVAKGPKYDVIANWIGSGRKILDVGCGAGEFSRRISNNNNDILGIEASSDNYNIAKTKITACFGDFLELQIRDHFDIVLFADVLEHMYCPEAAFKKAKKICDEIILCVPNFDFWAVKFLKMFGIRKMKSGILDEGHVYFFNKRIIERMIIDTGFEITDFVSPAPKRFPRIYNLIIELNPAVFGYQFIYRCKPRGQL